VIFLNKGFPKHHRLYKSEHYKRVFSKPDRFIGVGYNLLSRTNGVGFARLGLAVSKRNFPRSFDRNRIKRIVRESFRDRFYNLPSLDIIFLCSNDSIVLSNHLLRTSLEKSWNEIIDSSRIDHLY
jgi:ribonuclease P protein component